MVTRLVHAGFGNYVSAHRVRRAETPTSAPVQRLIREGKQGQSTVDLTSGRRTKLVLFMDTGEFFLLGITKKSWDARSARNRSSVPPRFPATRPLGAGPLLVVLTGPSGAGKDTLLAHLKSLGRPYHISVNATTRDPRHGESRWRRLLLRLEGPVPAGCSMKTNCWSTR